MTVRPGLPTDRPGAVEAWRAAEAGRGLRPNAARIARVEQKVADGLLVVAVSDNTDDTIIGMALGEPGRADDGAGDLEPGLLQLSMVFVVPAHQRKGVGAALVEALADATWEQGYRSVSVWTRTSEFYETIGFELTGRSQELPDGSQAVHLFAELEAPVREVVVRSEGIRLGQLLKLAELVDSGSDGKELLASGLVEVNDEVELRRGRQLVDGDEVRARDQAVRVVVRPE